MRTNSGCYISYFYIKPQLSIRFRLLMLVATFLISTSNRNLSIRASVSCPCCYISYFYIKPQLSPYTYAACRRCYISYFYIKPQRLSILDSLRSGCYISYFYIKPQLVKSDGLHLCVATFLISTSNRNSSRVMDCTFALLHFLFLHQTATKLYMFCFPLLLLHFLFLHQTATVHTPAPLNVALLHFLFLHQTAT